MEISKLINKKVLHNKYGEGIVVGASDNNFNVRFEDSDKECKFQYPSAFRTFLSCQDETLKAEIELDLGEWIKENGIIDKERIMAKTLETQKGITEREIERQKQRILKAKEDAKRSKMFADMNR